MVILESVFSISLNSFSIKVISAAPKFFLNEIKKKKQDKTAEPGKSGPAAERLRDMDE